MKKVRSAGAIVFYRDEAEYKFLLLQYIGKYWEFARGHIDPGEAEMETARREIIEETGLGNLKFLSNFKTQSIWQYERAGMGVDKKVTLFLAESFDYKVKISSEHIGYAWLSVQEALDRITYENSKKAFKEALDFLKIKYD